MVAHPAHQDWDATKRRENFLEALDLPNTLFPGLSAPRNRSARRRLLAPFPSLAGSRGGLRRQRINHLPNRTESLFIGKVLGVEVPRERAVDIDTEFDFRVAEAIYERPPGPAGETFAPI